MRLYIALLFFLIFAKCKCQSTTHEPITSLLKATKSNENIHIPTSESGSIVTTSERISTSQSSDFISGEEEQTMTIMIEEETIETTVKGTTSSQLTDISAISKTISRSSTIAPTTTECHRPLKETSTTLSDEDGYTTISESPLTVHSTEFTTSEDVNDEYTLELEDNILAQSTLPTHMNIESSNSYPESDALLITTLFSKINWLIMEVQQISNKMDDFQMRLSAQETATDEIQKNQHTITKQMLDILKMQNTTENRLREMENRLTKSLENIHKSCKKTLHTTAPGNGNCYNSPMKPLKENHNWLVILRRQDGSENFYRDWNDYRKGFGYENGEFFIGLEKLHAITTYGDKQQLLIVLEDFENHTRYALYDEFLVGNEDQRYILKKLGKYSGNAGDALRMHVNAMFSTWDRDNDIWPQNCAELFKGAWWFVRCFNSHLNGPYLRPISPIVRVNERGIIWKSFHGPGYSLKFVEMMIRPKTMP
ncbi:uncharacterized protein LOC142236199 isoform X2 [Haematobia irritans]|uniref:uncharacterized protein LOC142236199 isoform X2 n=1 Tax=Haematobia irritans TaxID=7368 RepID=UPI003F50AAEF